MIASGFSDGESVVHGGGQWLLNHGLNAVARNSLDGFYDDRKWSCTRQNGVRLLFDQHRFQINIKQGGRELEALGVLGSKGLSGSAIATT